ncbi:hypothetical protein EC845_3625 [Comamonas sp. BIGb0124]|uniref:hypothetical protein n=1 Tax=Comamonas sp. BIGb0124 TaxID=2485130 RepID=UPI000F472DF7|nr:hypothetical protein [Comamonas sp. BIGb0124]ROR18649.1 hypothetical protein EC845_3625 [Comamonas sp. BIGb0124]
MTIDYRSGRFDVVTADAQQAPIGLIDHDTFIRARQGSQPMFRLDGDEVYSLAGALLGFADDDGLVLDAKGRRLFLIRIK